MKRYLACYAGAALLIGVASFLYLCGPRLLLTEAYWLLPQVHRSHVTYHNWAVGYDYPGKYMMCYGAWHNIIHEIAPSCIPVDGEINRCHGIVTALCNGIYDGRP